MKKISFKDKSLMAQESKAENLKAWSKGKLEMGVKNKFEPTYMKYLYFPSANLLDNKYFVRYFDDEGVYNICLPITAECYLNE